MTVTNQQRLNTAHGHGHHVSNTAYPNEHTGILRLICIEFFLCEAAVEIILRTRRPVRRVRPHKACMQNHCVYTPAVGEPSERPGGAHYYGLFRAHRYSLELNMQCTLRASLSGTFLLTLPDLEGHSLSPRSYPPTRSAPSERFWY